MSNIIPQCAGSKTQHHQNVPTSEQNTTPIVLDLSSSLKQLSGEGIKALAQALKQCTVLTSIQLPNIDSRQLNKLAERLKATQPIAPSINLLPTSPESK